MYSTFLTASVIMTCLAASSFLVSLSGVSMYYSKRIEKETKYRPDICRPISVDDIVEKDYSYSFRWEGFSETDVNRKKIESIYVSNDLFDTNNRRSMLLRNGSMINCYSNNDHRNISLIDLSANTLLLDLFPTITLVLTMMCFVMFMFIIGAVNRKLDIEAISDSYFRRRSVRPQRTERPLWTERPARSQRTLIGRRFSDEPAFNDIVPI